MIIAHIRFCSYQLNVHGISIDVTVDSNGLDAELLGCTDDTACNLASIHDVNQTFVPSVTRYWTYRFAIRILSKWGFRMESEESYQRCQDPSTCNVVAVTYLYQ